MSELKSVETKLTALLTSDESSKLYRYMLIDELASVNDMDYISLASLQQLLGADRITTLLRPNLSHDPASCPKLITLAKPYEKIDTNIIHFSVIQAVGEYQERNRFICSWFVSEHPPETITQQFISLGEKLAEYCQTTFVPIYEPFRIFLLQNSNVFCPEWLLYSLKFIKTYVYLTIENQLDMIDCQQIYSNDLFLDFDAQYLQREAKAAFYFYRAWRQVEDNLSLAITIDAKTIFANYYKAYQLQLTDISDRSILGLMNLRYGGNIICNEQVAQAVSKAQQQPGTLAASFKQLDQSHFIQVTCN